MGKDKSEKIVIFPYNPEWKLLFAKEREILWQSLDGEYRSIIHIGSASIDGVDAKPIVDISIAVFELKDCAYYKEKLSPAGYSFASGHKFDEWFLFDKEEHGQAYHVHLMPHNSLRLFKQVLFKIFMEERPDARDLYARKRRHTSL